MRYGIALAPVLALAAAGCSYHTATVERRSTYGLDAGRPLETLEVDTRNGRVVLKTDPGRQGIVVVAKIKGSGPTEIEARQRAEDARLVFAVDSATGAAKLEVAFPDGHKSRDGCSFELEVPALERIVLRTGNGEVETCETHGELVARTSNGSVTIRAHEGSIDVATSNGPIVLAGVDGTLRAQTSNGSITIEPGNDGIDQLDVETSNGNVALRLGDRFSGRIDARVANGGIYCERSVSGTTGGLRARMLVFGEGAHSTIETSNGSITIR